MGTLITEAEVRAGESWASIGIEEALQRQGEDFRCPSCHGQMLAVDDDSSGTPSHFEHEQAFGACDPNPATDAEEHPDTLT